MGVGLVLLVGCPSSDDVTVPSPETEPPPWACGDLGSSTPPDVSAFVTAGLPADLQLVDLGVVTTACGFADPVTFDVPTGASSATVVLLADEGASFPSQLVSPDGTVVIDFDPTFDLDPLDATVFGPLAHALQSTNKVFPRGARSATLVPNNADVELLAGTWSLDVASFSQTVEGNALVGRGLDSAVHAYVLLRTAPSTQGILDVALHFSGSGDLTATNAPDDVQIQAALAALDTAYGPIGITIGDVTFDDLPLASTARSCSRPAPAGRRRPRAR